jgi:pimeloyl-ACP methyl ester carboxylesterase
MADSSRNGGAGRSSFERGARSWHMRLCGSLSAGWPSTATWRCPPHSGGIVLFAHGSGSSRHSPRNRRVAEHLQRAHLGTLLMDLLTADEEQLDLRSREVRFDIGLLARRLVGAVDWLAARLGGELRLGLFGASTGAAAALVAAVQRSDRVAAVVSRGGRPDLAGLALERVLAPTLADRERRRHQRPGAQPAGRRTAGRRTSPGGRTRRWSSVRGAGRAGCGRPPGRRLVRRPPRPEACRYLHGLTVVADGTGTTRESGHGYGAGAAARNHG